MIPINHYVSWVADWDILKIKRQCTLLSVFITTSNVCVKTKNCTTILISVLNIYILSFAGSSVALEQLFTPWFKISGELFSAVWMYDLGELRSRFIAQVYRLSAVHCQVTRYSQTVPGYLTRYSRCQPMKSLLTKKISQSECVFQLMLGLEEHYSPPPLGDFNRLFWRPNWSIIQIMTFKCDLFFKCH